MAKQDQVAAADTAGRRVSGKSKNKETPGSEDPEVLV